MRFYKILFVLLFLLLVAFFSKLNKAIANTIQVSFQVGSETSLQRLSSSFALGGSFFNLNPNRGLAIGISTSNLPEVAGITTNKGALGGRVN